MKNADYFTFCTKNIRRYEYLFYSVLISIFLLFSPTNSTSQNIDYEAQIINIYGSNCGDDGIFGGDNEHSWRVGLTNSYTSTPFTTLYTQNAPGATTYYIYKNYIGNNQPNHIIYYYIDAWEDDIGSRSIYESGDDCHVDTYCYQSLNNPLEYTWSPYLYTYNCGSADYNLDGQVRHRYSTIPLATAVDNPTVNFITSGNRPFWGSRGGWAYTNQSNGTSGTISHNQYSAFQTTVSCISSVSFYWRTLSQAGFDWLKVYVNSVCVDSISGGLNWSLKTIPLDYGYNTIEWRYVKDGSISQYDDRGFVDYITFNNAQTLNAGAIVGSQTICSGGDPGNISSLINSQVYSATPLYSWQYSPDGIGSWTSILASTLSSYDPPAGLLQDRFYRRVTNDACGNIGYSNVIKVTVNDHSASTDSITACDSYLWMDGNTYTSSTNTPTFVLSNALNCDSVITLDLTINNSSASTDVVTACNSYQWIDGLTYTSSNNAATYTLTNSMGCDSIVSLDLTINNSNASTDVVTACDSYQWIDGLTYIYSNNTATYTLTNMYNCDSIVSLDLQLSYSNTGTDVVTACNSYQWIDGLTYTSSNNSATYTLTNSKGCDSLVSLNLTINNSNSATDVVTACDSYQWIDGLTYTSSNNSATFTLTNSMGCDSLVSLDLTITNSSSATDVVTACDNYQWINGLTYTSSNNSATFTLTNSIGCDSLVSLDLTINNSNSATDVVTACDSYQWIDGLIYTSSNSSATFTLTNSIGCDSLVSLDLTINNSNSATDVVTACDSYQWIDGLTYTMSNNSATYTLNNSRGCDSLVSLDLTINNSNSATDVVTACDSYQWIDGLTYTSSNNSATFTLTNSNGCDSLVSLDLTINNSNSATDVVTACDSYQWIDGLTYTMSNNSATYTLNNSRGCDSLVSLDLTINNSNSATDVVTACDSFQWIDGMTYTSSNNSATFTLTNSMGCDSLVSLDLTINNSNSATDVVTACDSYQWIDGLTYTMSNNSATYTLNNSRGCDSLVSLDLTINNSNSATDVVTACDSFQWIDGMTYTSSNNSATFTLTNSRGCDSLVSLDLTINNSNSATDVVTACDSYQWIDGLTYTSSNNSATFTLTNSMGCDSLVSLDLTINNSNSATDVVTACDSYQWIDGLIYTSSNSSATFTLTNSRGCDSLVSLDLTINNSNSATDVVTACDSYQWIDGLTYTTNNNSATYTLTNSNGCDSLVSLDLTINNSNSATDVVTACDSYQWIDGLTYTSSNNSATFNLTNSNGCDSLVSLDLTIDTTNTSITNTGDSLYSLQANAIYQWVDCDNAFATIPGANSQGFKPTQSGNYALIIANGNCRDTSICENIIITGITERRVMNKLEIYPNPTREFFTIVTEETSSLERLQIFDLRGTLVKEVQLKSKKGNIDVSDLAHGLYYIKYMNTYQKLIIVE